MPEELDDFDSLFNEFETEITDEDPISEEEAALIEEDTEDEGPTVIVPKDEEDFKTSQGGDEDETEEDEDEEEGEQDKDEEDGAEYFKTVGEGLIKLGKLKDVPKDFKWSQENFIAFFDEVSMEKAQASIEDILTAKKGDEGLELFNDLFVKNAPVKEYLALYAEEQDYSSLDLEKVGNQKLMIKAYLEEMGQDEDEIFEQIETLEERGVLKERAEKYQGKIVELRASERKQMADQAEAHEKERARLIRERDASLSKVVEEAVKTKEINGIPLSIDDHKTLLPYMTAPAYRTPTGQNVTQMEKDLMELRKDPVKWTALAKLIKEGLNVKPIQNKGVDDKKEQLFNFTRAKKTPTKSDVDDQLDLLFKRKRNK